MQRLTGIGASPGVVAGRAVILIRREQVLRYRVPAARVEKEVTRLSAGWDATREQLTEIRTSVSRPRRRASRGRCSQTRTPGRAVATVPKLPRTSRGASGLGSSVSR